MIVGPSVIAGSIKRNESAVTFQLIENEPVPDQFVVAGDLRNGTETVQRPRLSDDPQENIMIGNSMKMKFLMYTLFACK